MDCETPLVPTLSPCDVVILDNVGFYKSERAEQLVKAHGFYSCRPIRQT
nr:transposase [Brucella anthropi]